MSNDVDNKKENKEETSHSKLILIISDHIKEVVTGIFVLIGACIGATAMILAACMERPTPVQSPIPRMSETISAITTQPIETNNINPTTTTTLSLIRKDLKITTTPTETSIPIKTSTVIFEPTNTSTPPPEVSDSKTIDSYGTEKVTLLEGEIIVGTADVFRNEEDQPPTVFLIIGPYEMELSIYKGSWEKWKNVYDERFIEYRLYQKYFDLENHEDYEYRGIRIVRLEPPIIYIPEICRKENVCECNWQFAIIGADFPKTLDDTFLLKNVGDDVLELGTETTTCEECLAGWHNPANGDIVLPGEHTQFIVEYSRDLDPLKGADHEHMITISSNASNCPILTIKTTIRYK